MAPDKEISIGETPQPGDKRKPEPCRDEWSVDELVKHALVTEDDEEYWGSVVALSRRDLAPVRVLVQDLIVDDRVDRRELGADILGAWASSGKLDRRSVAVEQLLSLLMTEDEPAVVQAVVAGVGHAGDGRARARLSSWLDTLTLAFAKRSRSRFRRNLTRATTKW